MSSESLPSFVVRARDVMEATSAYPAPFDQAALAAGRDLGRAAGTRGLGVWLDRLPTGARTSFTHAHLREEELVYVLSGRPTLRWTDGSEPAKEVELAAGDLASFPAGTGRAHCFVNRAPEDAELLVIGERRTGERLAYPEDPMFEAWRAEHRPLRTWPDREGPDGGAVWPAWRVHTERLVLRPWTVDDVPDLARLQRENHAHLAPWMPWARALPTLDELLRTVTQWGAMWANDENLPYGMFLLDGTPIGGVGIHPKNPHLIELGYWVAQDRQGQGYVTEAAGALTRLVLETRRAQCVEIHHDPVNVRSGAVPRRLGFRHTGTLPGRQQDVHGRPRDTAVWSMLRDDLAASPASAIVATAWDGLGRRLV